MADNHTYFLKKKWNWNGVFFPLVRVNRGRRHHYIAVASLLVILKKTKKTPNWNTIKRAGKTSFRKLFEIETLMLLHTILNFLRRNKCRLNLEASKVTGKFSTDLNGIRIVLSIFLLTLNSIKFQVFPVIQLLFLWLFLTLPIF